MDEVLRDLQGGADVNSRSDTGVTALMYASRACSSPMVELLLKSGADANAIDSDGRPALVYAVKESCSDVVHLLFRTSGLRWGLRDHGGRAALDYARDMALTDVDGPAVDILAKLSRAATVSDARRSPRDKR